MAELDLVIRGGTVADGTGGPTRTADVAIRDGVVVEVGRVTAGSRRVIDADGALVTPGFVDIHTHYDGQATWDDAPAALGRPRRDDRRDGQLRRRVRAGPTPATGTS